MKKSSPILLILVVLMLVVCHREEVGWISITSTPVGAAIYLDDSLTDEVTNYVLEVEVGDHTVRLIRDDYKDWVRSVTVEEGDTIELNADYWISDTVQPGDVLWKYDVGYEGKISSPAISPEGAIYFSALNESTGTLYALKPDGSILWNLTDKTSFPVIASDGLIYCLGLNDNSICAVSPCGSVAWNYAIDASICESPASGVDGSVYFTSGWGMRMYALTSSGGFKWEFDLKDTRYYHSPTIGIDGTIYFVYNDPYYGGGCLMAMSDDREIIWEYSPWINIHTKASLQEGGWAIPPSIASDGSLYYSLSWEREYDYWECELHGVNPDGTRQWRDGWSDNRINSVPVLGSDGSLYMGFNNCLYAFDSDGKGRWSFSAVVYGSPAVGADGNIYFGSSDGCFYVVNSSGELEWKIYLGGTWFSSPAISDEGIVYIGSDDGYLYAIYTESGGLANTSWSKFKADNQNTGRARF